MDGSGDDMDGMEDDDEALLFYNAIFKLSMLVSTIVAISSS